MNCYILFIMFFILIVIISIFHSLTMCKEVYGGNLNILKNFNIDIWDKNV